jgi:hypothetical protein
MVPDRTDRKWSATGRPQCVDPVVIVDGRTPALHCGHDRPCPTRLAAVVGVALALTTARAA